MKEKDIDKINGINHSSKSLLHKKENTINIIDISFVAFCICLAVYYFFSISSFQLPSWDGASFLANAKAWLNGGTPLPESFRPPLLSWIISGVWMVTGEQQDWTAVKYLPGFFTISSGILLYFVLRKHKGSIFSLFVTVLTMLNPLVLFWGAQIMSESVSLFFLMLSLYLLKSEKSKHWFLAGITIGLTFASRYPMIIPAFTIFLVEAIIVRQDARFAAKTILGILPTVLLVILIVYLKTGAVNFALPQDTHFGLLPSVYYYLNNWAEIWGWSFIFIPLAFLTLLFKDTFADRFNYTFIVWFLVSIAFWGANATNHQDRFAVDTLAPAYFIAFLGIENAAKILGRRHLFLER